MSSKIGHAASQGQFLLLSTQSFKALADCQSLERTILVVPFIF